MVAISKQAFISYKIVMMFVPSRTNDKNDNGYKWQNTINKM